MTNLTNLKQLIRYSPKPLSGYSRTVAGVEVGPAGSPMLRAEAAWNLAYLSHDYEKRLQHLDPEFNVLVRRTCQTKLDGSGIDVACPDDSRSVVAHLLSHPAPRFVHLIKQLPVLATLPLYLKYGQAWLDTITERSHRCQADEVPSDNVVDLSAAKALLSKF